MPREDDDAAVVENDNEDRVGVEFELDPKDEAKIVPDDEPGDDPVDDAIVVTDNGRAPNEPEPPKPEVKAVEEPPKPEPEKPKREWDKARQQAQERAAKAEKAMIETNEKVARLMGEIEGMKLAITTSRATPEQKAEAKDELDDILAELDTPDDLSDGKSAKVLKVLAQRVKQVQAENAELRTSAKALHETEEKRSARDQQMVNKAALEQLKLDALAGDEYRNTWEVLRNPLTAALPDALKRYGYSTDKLPNADTLRSIIDAEVRDLKLRHLTGKDAPPKETKPKADQPPVKPAEVPPPPKPQPKRAMGLAEKLAQIRKNGYRWQQK